MSLQNPYAPPAKESPVQPADQPRPDDGRMLIVLTTIFVWAGCASLFCFVGKRIGKFNDLFGFGGMALCLVGVPVIGALMVRRRKISDALRLQCLLDVFGLLVFITGLGMQATGSVNNDMYWVYSAMCCIMIGFSFTLSAVRNRNRNRIRAKGKPS